MELQFSQGDLGALARMSFLAEREAGRRFKLSQSESVVELLQHVATSPNLEIGKLFRDFVSNLEVSVREQLVYRGIPVPEELRQQAASESAEVASVVKKSRRVYRGQVIEGEEEVSVPQAATQQAAATPAEPKKRPKRIYRGRVIED